MHARTLGLDTSIHQECNVQSKLRKDKCETYQAHSKSIVYFRALHDVSLPHFCCKPSADATQLQPLHVPLTKTSYDAAGHRAARRTALLQLQGLILRCSNTSALPHQV